MASATPNSNSTAHHPWAEYGVAIAFVVAAAATRWLLNPVLGDAVPYITFFPAVVVAAWYGGLRPALLATFLGGMAAWFLFVPHRLSFAIKSTADLIGLCVFFAMGLAIAGFGGAMRAAQHRAADAERIASQNAERMRTTLASIGDAVIATDSLGRVSFLNPVAESLTGWTTTEAAGLPLEQVFHIVNESSRKPVENPAARALRDGQIVGLANHTLLIAKDGRELPIDDSAAPIKDDHGEVVGCVLVFRNVAQQRQATRALQASEDRKSAMFESALDCIISMDHTGTVIEFNAAAEQAFGYHRDEVLGRELASIIIPPHFREDHRQGLTRYLATGEGPVINQRLELSALHSSGREFPVELTVTRIPVEGPPQFTAYLRDITDRKAAEEKLRQVAAELSEADRRKDEFLAMLAHELRNPLAPIRNALEIIRPAVGSEEPLASASSMMERQVGQMVRLIDDLLDVSRISRGKIELKKRRIELASSINYAVEAVHPMLESMNHQLEVTLPSQPVYLDADATRLAQIMGNVLTNACKFTASGGHIALSVECDGEKAVIKVRDNGIGIAAENLPRVFDLFMQADTSLERTASGLGIGLTLVKNLVELHGGSIQVTSDGVGKGSEVQLRLPAAAPIEAAMPPAAKPVAVTSRRILVVDDNRDSATSLSMLLKRSGHVTHVAHDGLDAVEAFGTFAPEIALLDIGLPGLNGYEVARRIRETGSGDGVVLVALTGWGQDGDRRKSQEAGFDGHLTKPVEFAALNLLLSELLASRDA